MAQAEIKVYRTRSCPFCIMAAAWFRRAAGLGETDAQYILGVFLSKGIGGAENPEEARDWLRRAALQGDSRRQFSPGV